MPTQQEIDDLRGWFQNIHFPDGKESAPGVHYPRCVWGDVKPFLPADLSGKSVLDIGCNGGFMEIELEAMGAVVTAIDNQEKHVRQTRLVKRELGLKCEVHLESVD